MMRENGDTIGDRRWRKIGGFKGVRLRYHVLDGEPPPGVPVAPHEPGLSIQEPISGFLRRVRYLLKNESSSSP